MDKINIPGWQKIVKLAFIIISIILAFKFVVTLFIPFIIAFVIAMIINPGISYINKKTHININILTSVFIILFIIIAGGIVYLLCHYACAGLKNIFGSYNEYENILLSMQNELCHKIEGFTGVNSSQISYFMADSFSRFKSYIQELLFPEMVKNTLIKTTTAFQLIGEVFIIFISVFIIVKDYKEIKCFIIDSYYGNKIFSILRNLKSAIKKYVKAQSIIMLSISVVTSIFFICLKVSHPIVLAFLLGGLDTLPIIGSGLFLIPYSIIQLITGNYLRAAAFFILYIICSLIREILEPRLVGKTLSIHPLSVLISVYIGLELFGVAGFLYGPFGYILASELYNEFEKNKSC